MSLDLNKRPCRIGPSVNTRTEKHGDDDVPACDIPIEGLMLDRDELHLLLGKGAHSFLFTTKKNSGMDFAEISDFAKKLSPFKLADKFEDSRVELVLGLDGEVVEIAGDVKIAKVKLEPQAGGLTAMAVTVQCTPTTDTMAQIFAFMNHDIEASVRFGKKSDGKKSDKQAELPMKTKGGSEDGAQETTTH